MADDSFFPDFNISYTHDYNFYTPEPEPFSTPEFSYSPLPEKEMTLPYQSSDSFSYSADNAYSFGLNEEQSPYQNVLNAVSGYVGGGFTLQSMADNYADKTYYETFENSLSRSGGNKVSALQDATSARSRSYSDFGIDPLEIFGTNSSKAYTFTKDYAFSSAPATAPTPDLILKRILNNDGPSPYLARVLSKDPLNNYDDPSIAKGDTAWLTPLDEAIGQKLNEAALIKRLGFSESDVNAPSGNKRLLMIYPSEHLDTMLATWENTIVRAEASEKYKSYLDNDPNLWDNLKNYDYAAEKEKAKAYMSKDIDYKAAADLYAETLTGQQKNLFKARSFMDINDGYNELYTGKGYTKDYQGNVGNREFIADNQHISQMKPLAVLELRDGTIALHTTEILAGVPNKVLTGKAAAQTGIMSALTSAYFEGKTIYKDYIDGKITGSDVLSRLGTAGAVGSAVGIGSAAAEKWVTETKLFKALGNYADQATLLKNGALLSGQGIRQYTGSGLVGGMISGALSGVQQFSEWSSGKVSAERAIGNVAAETTIGTATTIGGMAAGAAATYGATAGLGALGISVGTSGALALLTGPIGLGLIAGATGGYYLDKTIRSYEIDKWISNKFTGAAEAVSAASGYAYDVAADAGYEVYATIGDAGIAAIDYSVDLAADSYYTAKDYSKRAAKGVYNTARNAWSWVTDW